MGLELVLLSTIVDFRGVTYFDKSFLRSRWYFLIWSTLIVLATLVRSLVVAENIWLLLS